MMVRSFTRLVSRIVLVGIAVWGSGGLPAFAQLRIVGAISGTVEDPTGAVVPNAKVILKDTKTGLTKETVSSPHGTFLFPDLASGVYEITVNSGTRPVFASATLIIPGMMKMKTGRSLRYAAKIAPRRASRSLGAPRARWTMY